jgi:hypothetical protein
MSNIPLQILLVIRRAAKFEAEHFPVPTYRIYVFIVIITLSNDGVTGWSLWPLSVFCKAGTAFFVCFHTIIKYGMI